MIKEPSAPIEAEQTKRIVEWPEDLFTFDTEQAKVEEDHIPTSWDRAKQIAPKILRVLEQLNPDERAGAIESFEEIFYVDSPANNPDDASTLLTQIYKELLLLKI